MGSITIMIYGPLISKHGGGRSCNALVIFPLRERAMLQPSLTTLYTFLVVEVLMVKI